MRPSAQFFVSSRLLPRNSAAATVVVRERRTRNHWRRPLEEVLQSSWRRDVFAQEPPEEPKRQPVVRAATQQDRARSRALIAHDPVPANELAAQEQSGWVVDESQLRDQNRDDDDNRRER